MTQGASKQPQKLWTRDDVESKSSLSHPLLIYKNKVYDVTDFVESHPGGDILLDYHGQDITHVMLDVSFHVHSDAAMNMMEDYYVGSLAVGSSSDLLMNHIEAESSTINGEYVASGSEMDKVSSVSKYVDFDKPIFLQIWNLNLSKQEYLKLIHTPHHLNHTARFFQYGFLEVFSRTPWWLVPLLWIPYSCHLFYQSVIANGNAESVKLFVFGLALWTFMEYMLHRFLFHIDDQLPDNKIALILHFTFHGVHHFLPMDRYRLVFPPALALPILVMFWKLLLSTCTLATAYGVLSGGVIGYVLYDMTHYALHHSRFYLSHLKEMKSYHMLHHYKDFHSGYGITSKFWDKIFFTELK
ncbi:hypothetical protein MIR68_000993 [Amoeboaphelidium protococcarum]|nr:hypothetical protein MIR68_000993 [Amoeboaphelidium protococcarum]